MKKESIYASLKDVPESDLYLLDKDPLVTGYGIKGYSQEKKQSGLWLYIFIEGIFLLFLAPSVTDYGSEFILLKANLLISVFLFAVNFIMAVFYRKREQFDFCKLYSLYTFLFLFNNFCVVFFAMASTNDWFSDMWIIPISFGYFALLLAENVIFHFLIRSRIIKRILEGHYRQDETGFWTKKQFKKAVIFAALSPVLFAIAFTIRGFASVFSHFYQIDMEDWMIPILGLIIFSLCQFMTLAITLSGAIKYTEYRILKERSR